MATYDVILERLIGHLSQLSKSEVEINADTDLVGTLGLDSVAVLNLLLDLEDEFDVSVQINALADITTAGELAKLIHTLSEGG